MFAKPNNNLGRLGNQIIRNLATSLIAEKHDLYFEYTSYDKINKLGINLYIGKNKYRETIKLGDDNFFEILNKDKINYNVGPYCDFFQTKDITNYLYKYLQNVKDNIINANNFKNRYNNNNDLFIHIRVDDAEIWNSGYEYYLEAIEKISYDKIYLSSDNFNSHIVQNIKKKYNDIEFINYDEVNTIMFASTCKHIILSHGSFSAVIGYLGFFSKIYYPKYSRAKKIWFGDMFSIDGWIEV